MTAPTQPVTVRLSDFGGPAVEGVKVTATTSGIDFTVGGTFVSTEPVVGFTDATGEVVLQLFPNAVTPTGLGTRGTTVRVFAQIPHSRPLDVQAIVPDTPCNLVNILTSEQPPDLDAAELAILQAQEGAAVATTQAGIATAQEGIATAAAGTATAQAVIATAQAAISTTKANESSFSAVEAKTARDDLASAIAAAGIVKFYDTYALAIADVANVALNAVVQVFADEGRGSRRTLYKKTSVGVLTFEGFADGPQSSNGGAGAMIRRVPGVAANATAGNGAVVVEMGDSNSAGSAGDPMTLYIAPMPNPGTATATGVLGHPRAPFYGWTAYNKGASGTGYHTWAQLAEAIIAVPATSNGLADIVALNPSVLLIQLGTNDFNSATNKANWTDAFFRARMAVLVNFLLARTKASIVLCMPHPLNWNNGVASLTQFTDAAEAREVNRIIRDAHRDWIGKSDRVEVFDSHTALFGNFCDDETTHCLDPETGVPLINDGLHMSSTGSSRRNQYLIRQLDRKFRFDGSAQVAMASRVVSQDNTNPLNITRVYTGPLELVTGALWRRTIYGTASNAGGKTLFSFAFDNAWADALTALADTMTRGQPAAYNAFKQEAERLELLSRTTVVDAVRDILGVNNLTPFKVVRHSDWATFNVSFSGTAYSLTKGGASGFSNGKSWTLGILLEGDLFTTTGNGDVFTFYGTTPESRPYANLAVPTHSVTIPDAVNDLVWAPPITPLSGNAFTGAFLTVPAPGADGGGTYELYKSTTTEISAGGTETLIATFARGNQVQRATTTVVGGQVLNTDAAKPLFRFKRLTGSTKALVLTLY